MLWGTHMVSGGVINPTANAWRLGTTLPAPAIVEWPPPGRIRAVRREGDDAAIPVGGDGRRFALPAGHAAWRIDLAESGGAR